MDLAVNFVDRNIIDPYLLPNPPEWFSHDSYLRQYTTVFVIWTLGGWFAYLFFASLSFFYFFVYKGDVYFPGRKPDMDQVRREISLSLRSIPPMAVITAPIFVGEIRGWSQLYDSVDEYGWGYFFFSILIFLCFTDFGIYWIHRGLHDIKFLYTYIHAPHHAFKVPTPFASHAFHPLDGFAQSCPYHIFVYLFPLHKLLYMGLFIFVNFWTISIHDGISRVPGDFLNGAAHHSEHHLYFRCNYGQYFTFWDKVGGTYKDPRSTEEIKAKLSKAA